MLVRAPATWAPGSAPQTHLQGTEGQAAGLQRGDALGQVAGLLRLPLLVLLLPALLGLGQHQTLDRTEPAEPGAQDPRVPRPASGHEGKEDPRLEPALASGPTSNMPSPTGQGPDQAALEVCE